MIYKRTEWGKDVLCALIRQDKKQKWLMEKVTEKTGMYMDSSTFSKYITGRTCNPDVIACINSILGIGTNA